MQKLLQAVGASIRIFELMDRESEVKDGDQVLEQFGRGIYMWCLAEYDPSEGVLVSAFSLAGITFHNVCFSYPSRPDEPVLRVSIDIMHFTSPPGVQTNFYAGY